MFFKKRLLRIIFLIGFGLTCPEKGLAIKWNQPDEMLLPESLRPYTQAVGTLKTPTGSGTCWVTTVPSQTVPPFILTAAHVVEEIYESHDYQSLKAEFYFGTFPIQKVYFLADYYKAICGPSKSLIDYRTDLALLFPQGLELPSDVTPIPLGYIDTTGAPQTFPPFPAFGNESKLVKFLPPYEGLSPDEDYIRCIALEKLSFDKPMFMIARPPHISIDDTNNIFSIIESKPQINTLPYPTVTQTNSGNLQIFYGTAYGPKFRPARASLAQFESVMPAVKRSTFCDTLTQVGINFPGSSGAPLLLAQSGLAVGLHCAGTGEALLKKFCENGVDSPEIVPFLNLHNDTLWPALRGQRRPKVCRDSCT